MTWTISNSMQYGSFQEYVSREHTHHPNPKLRQLFPSIAAMFIDTPMKHAALCLVQARHRACTISFQPYQSWLCCDSKIRSSTYTIHMTLGPMKRNGSNLDCFNRKPQAFQWCISKININRIIVHCTTGAMSQRNQYPRAAYLHERRIELWIS